MSNIIWVIMCNEDHSAAMDYYSYPVAWRSTEVDAKEYSEWLEKNTNTSPRNGVFLEYEVVELSMTAPLDDQKCNIATDVVTSTAIRCRNIVEQRCLSVDPIAEIYKKISDEFDLDTPKVTLREII